MTKLLRNTYRLLVLLGIDPLQTVRFAKGLPRYIRDLLALQRQMASRPALFSLGRYYPCLDDWYSASGSASGHYFHQDLLVARRVGLHNPQRHVDVGSRIDGFVAHVASFRVIDVIDIRPLPAQVNIRFTQVDVMAPLPAHLLECCDSLSCLHAAEHFGLGRYGDTVNADGYLLGLNNLYRMLQPGGKLYFSVPIGPQRIEFNAHRVFSVGYLLQLFAGRYRLDRFSVVDDHGALHEDLAVTEDEVRRNYGCMLGCGIFELTKLAVGGDSCLDSPVIATFQAK